MTTSFDLETGLESGEYVPVCHFLKFCLDFSGNVVFENLESAMSSSNLSRPLKKESKESEDSNYNCGKVDRKLF